MPPSSPDTDNRTVTVVTLTADAFQAAIASYVDEHKPDPLAKRQLEGWNVTWENNNDDDGDDALLMDSLFGEDVEEEEEEDRGSNNKDGTADHQQQQQLLALTHRRLQGILTIQGEYVTVQLQFYCGWNSAIDDDDDDGESSTSTTKNASSSSSFNDGTLLYCCRVHSAKLRHEAASDNDDKTQRKIRRKMLERLGKDSYIAKLLAVSSTRQQQLSTKSSSYPSSSSTVFDPILAKARIQVDHSKFLLEERVDVSETVAEALRRAVWGSTESSLDVVEVILALPSLPCSTTTTSTSHGGINMTTPLANRAKLRLLEDAMLDECEKAGEGELIQELNISASAADATAGAASENEQRDEVRRQKEERDHDPQHRRHQKKKSRSQRK